MMNHVSLKRDRYYSTKELSKLFRVNESTIKRWADSGKLKCFRTPGGHRKYTPEHVFQFVQKYQYDLLDSHVDVPDQFEKESQSMHALKDNHHVHARIYFAHALRAETDSLVDILWNSYRSGTPLVEIYDEIVAETIREMLSRWKQGNLSTAEERIVASAVSESILKFQSLLPNGVFNGKIAVCGSFTNGFQEVILHATSHLLETAGWKVYSLGSWVSTEVFLESIQKYSPGLVCASSEGVTNGIELKKHDGNGGSDHNPLIEAAERINAQVLLWNFEGFSDDAKKCKQLERGLLVFSTFKEMLTLMERNGS